MLNTSMIRVSAKKDNVIATLNVDIISTPGFFKDRTPVIIDGIKKKIFHIVRPHKRVTGNWTTNVHMHFRGLREFEWNGYQIHITVPGRDHILLPEMSASAAMDGSPAHTQFVGREEGDEHQARGYIRMRTLYPRCARCGADMEHARPNQMYCIPDCDGRPPKSEQVAFEVSGASVSRPSHCVSCGSLISHRLMDKYCSIKCWKGG
jgi:hypothetical protein